MNVSLVARSLVPKSYGLVIRTRYKQVLVRMHVKVPLVHRIGVQIVCAIGRVRRMVQQYLCEVMTKAQLTTTPVWPASFSISFSDATS